MKRNKILSMIVVAILTVGSIFGMMSMDAYAGRNTMTVSPPNQKIILMPGETYKNSITVFNASDSTGDLTYSVFIGSYSESKGENSKDDYGNVDVVSVGNYNQIKDWIKVDKKTGTIAPNTEDIITYTIEVPEDAPAGGQYATIIVRDDTGKDNDTGGNVMIQSNYQIASIIYAEVAGETREVGKIIDNTVPSFMLNGPLVTESMVRNDGNVHTDAEYMLQVWPLFGNEEICTNEESAETSLILPGTERYHAQTCDNVSAAGIYRAKQTVKIFGETSVVEKIVILCPLWLLFLIIFVVIALIMWIFMIVKKRKKHEAARNPEE